MTDRAPVTYREAGVNIDAGEELVERIKPHVRRSMRREVLGGIGGFGALVELPLDRYRKPVLVSGTDGVGTKLRLAIDTGRHDTVGIDLVAMCVNDVVVQGAEPLFFLDYFATGALDVAIGGAGDRRHRRGLRAGGLRAGRRRDRRDAGHVPRRGLRPRGLQRGDRGERPHHRRHKDARPATWCWASPPPGPHSNGFSLIRKILEVSGTDPATPVEGIPLIDRLMAPTRIYVKPLLKLLGEIPVHGLAHITGGGLVDNVPRVLPEGLEAVLERSAWARDPVFDWLQRAGRVADAEMYRVFNCGIGMTVHVRRGERAAGDRDTREAGRPERAGHRRDTRGHARSQSSRDDPARADRRADLGPRQQYARAGGAQRATRRWAIKWPPCSPTSRSRRARDRAPISGCPRMLVAADHRPRRAPLRRRARRRDRAICSVADRARGFHAHSVAPFVARYAGRILNIHPSLLPKYPGLHTHRRVLAAREARARRHRAFRHRAARRRVRAVIQARVRVEPGDDAQSLQPRVHVLEHRIYPLAVRWYCTGRLRYGEGRAWLDGEPLRLRCMYDGAEVH